MKPQRLHSIVFVFIVVWFLISVSRIPSASSILCVSPSIHLTCSSLCLAFFYILLSLICISRLPFLYFTSSLVFCASYGFPFFAFCLFFLSIPPPLVLLTSPFPASFLSFVSQKVSSVGPLSISYFDILCILLFLLYLHFISCFFYPAFSCASYHFFILIFPFLCQSKIDSLCISHFPVARSAFLASINNLVFSACHVLLACKKYRFSLYISSLPLPP